MSGHGSRCKQGVRLTIITLEGTDDGPLPVQQSKSQGVARPPMPLALPYGMFANVPADTPAYEFMVLHQSENRFLLPLSWRKRPKSSPPGDVGLFSPEHNTTEIRLKASGDMSITTDGNHVEIVNGKMTVESTGEMVLKASKITLDGPVEFTSTLTSTSTGIEHRDHKHDQGDDAGGDAQVDVGVPKN